MRAGIWERASELGIRVEHALDERRRIRVCNQITLVGMATGLGFAAAYVAIGARAMWVPILVNLVAAALYGAVLAAQARGRLALARWLLVASTNLHVTGAAQLFGPAAGFQYYAFVLLAVGFLVMPRSDGAKVLIGPALSLAGFAWVEYLGPREGLWMVLSPEVARLVHSLATGLVATTLAFVVWLFWAAVHRAEQLLEVEHRRSEDLLLNVLPVSISTRLKAGEEPIADRFDEATVLFADIAGFTELSGRLPAEQLATLLGRIFSAFDDLTSRFRLEKIKTIGDAYMVVGGLPEPRADHAEVVADMALAMRDALDRVARELGQPLALRIGIHTGPVVAGVIGKRKFAYDLWGDTVNTASRMESHGEVGRIQVTEAVEHKLRGAFALTARGTIHVKGKGEMATWFLDGRRA